MRDQGQNLTLKISEKVMRITPVKVFQGNRTNRRYMERDREREKVKKLAYVVTVRFGGSKI